MSLLSDLLALNAKPIAVTEAEHASNDELEHMVELLSEYHEKLVHLMGEVKDIVHMLPRQYSAEAKAYWLPHILIALGGDHDYMVSRSESTMASTIKAMKDEAEAVDDYNGFEGGED